MYNTPDIADLDAPDKQQKATMKPFEGCVMSTSGGNASDKKRLAELITSGGGTYSKDLTRACTHLLIKAAARDGTKMSDKEKAAREWGTVRVLYEAWVADAMAAGATEAAYIVPDTRASPPKGPPQTAQAPQPQVAPRIPQGVATLQYHSVPEAPAPGPRPPSAHQHSSAEQQRAVASRPGSAAHSLRHQPAASAVPASVSARHAQGEDSRANEEAARQEHSSHGRIGSQDPSACVTGATDASGQQPSGTRPEQSDADFLSSGRSPQAPHHAPAPSTSGRNWRQAQGECAPYLDGLRVFVACAAPSEFMDLVSTCREGGACRYPRLEPLITHIVVGADRLADELACIKQHQQRHSALVRVVDAGWLRACSTLRLRVGEEAHALGPAALLPPASASARELATMQGNREASRGAWDGEGTRHGSASVSEGGGSRAFTDCWFTLAALEGDPVEQQRVRKVIRQGGGRIFDAGRTNLVTNLASAYAVCPLGFPPQLRREAMRHPDFKKVPEANYVTAYWVELSEKELKPMRELGHRRVTCAPLPYSLPMPGMAYVRLCASNMEDEEKFVIKELVKHLGGLYTVKMNKTNTHLIVERATGQKWANAAAFGVIAVTTDWLVDSAKAGRLLPEKEYEPPAPAPGELIDAAVTQFPFELIARPTQQQPKHQAPRFAQPQLSEAARPAGEDSQAEAAFSAERSSAQAAGPPADALLSAAFQQDVARSDQENDPLEALLAEGDKQPRQGGSASPRASRARQRAKLQEMKASISNQDNSSDKEPATKEGEQSEVWEAATRLGNFLEAVPPPMMHGSQLDINDLVQRSASAGGSRAGRQLSNLGESGSAGEGGSGHSGDSAGRSPTRKRTRRGSLSGTNSAGSSGRQSARAAARAETASVQHFQCSQQVGYGKKHGPGVSTRRRAADNAKSNLVADSNAVEKLAKQRLAEAMRSSTRQGASGEDALKLVLGIAE